MLSAKLLILVYTLVCLDFVVSATFKPPCCGRWNKYGFIQLGGQYPSLSPECRSGITRLGFYQNRMKIIFEPNHTHGILGLSVCRDIAQNDCYVLSIFGIQNGRLGYRWTKHSLYETGNKTWVPGRAGNLEQKLLREELPEIVGTWDNTGRTPYWFFVERKPNGLEVRMDGGDPDQQREMSFSISDHYNKFTVATFLQRGRAEVVGALGSDEMCGLPKRMTFVPGQEMRLKFFHKNKDTALGVSICSDPGQSECYVLFIFGESNKILHFEWRKHSLREKGALGWVPGKKSRLRGTVLKETFRSGNVWQEKRDVSITFRRSDDGTLRVAVEGGDVSQNKNLVFDLNDRFQSTAVDVFDPEQHGAMVGVLGPCFNGEVLGYLCATCETPIRLRGNGLHTRQEMWSLQPGLSRADLTSPPIHIDPDTNRLCVSVSGIASPGARLTVKAVPVGGDSTKGVPVGDLFTDASNPPQWQFPQLVVELPSILRSGSIQLVFTAERKRGSVLIINYVELCGIGECGGETATIRPNIVQGKNASLAAFPWHAGLYQNGKYMCGGNLVRPDMVITAAHCLHGGDFVKRPLDTNEFQVAVGKLHVDLYPEEPYQQISNVTAIHIPEGYGGVQKLLEHDIAVLEVNFFFNSVVAPVCLDWTGRSLHELTPGDTGLVAGWGNTETFKPSDVLLFGQMRYVSAGECRKAVREPFQRFITAEKFCAGNINGTTVKSGDSGGGLSFKVSGRWYLRGLVSAGDPDVQTYSTFLDIKGYLDWINGILQEKEGHLLTDSIDQQHEISGFDELASNHTHDSHDGRLICIEDTPGCVKPKQLPQKSNSECESGSLDPFVVTACYLQPEFVSSGSVISNSGQEDEGLNHNPASLQNSKTTSESSTTTVPLSTSTLAPTTTLPPTTSLPPTTRPPPTITLPPITRPPPTSRPPPTTTLPPTTRLPPKISLPPTSTSIHNTPPLVSLGRDRPPSPPHNSGKVFTNNMPNQASNSQPGTVPKNPPVFPTITSSNVNPPFRNPSLSVYPKTEITRGQDGNAKQSDWSATDQEGDLGDWNTGGSNGGLGGTNTRTLTGPNGERITIQESVNTGPGERSIQRKVSVSSSTNRGNLIPIPYGRFPSSPIDDLNTPTGYFNVPEHDFDSDFRNVPSSSGYDFPSINGGMFDTESWDLDSSSPFIVPSRMRSTTFGHRASPFDQLTSGFPQHSPGHSIQGYSYDGGRGRVTQESWSSPSGGGEIIHSSWSTG